MSAGAGQGDTHVHEHLHERLNTYDMAPPTPITAKISGIALNHMKMLIPNRKLIEEDNQNPTATLNKCFHLFPVVREPLMINPIVPSIILENARAGVTASITFSCAATPMIKPPIPVSRK